MKKVVLNLDLHDDRIQKKAMKAVSGISRVESLSVDKNDQKLTLIGDVDPVQVVGKLRKFCCVQIVSVGPAKEEEKKEPEKEEKPDEKVLAALKKACECEAYLNQMRMIQYPYHYYRTVEEDPNGCVIC